LLVVQNYAGNKVFMVLLVMNCAHMITGNELCSWCY